jgi:hypothetical protein
MCEATETIVTQKPLTAVATLCTFGLYDYKINKYYFGRWMNESKYIGKKVYVFRDYHEKETVHFFLYETMQYLGFATTNKSSHKSTILKSN